MMRLTARFAQEWNTWGSVDFASERRAQFVAACESVDVDPASKRTSVQALVSLTDTQEEADEVLAGPMGTRSIAGTADTLTEQLHGYAAAGFDEFIMPDFNLGGSAEERTDNLQRLHDEVLAPLLG
jgi:alkanesulfonate monooxygenase SsuD/methylene tetrahydromethanopterin reductase-like flavin-dependent oxidoreductase (luciferase family)